MSWFSRKWNTKALTKPKVDWEKVNIFNKKVVEVNGLTYEKLIDGLPKEVLELIDDDELITKAFEHVKVNPYLGFAYLLGIIQSWREFKTKSKDIDEVLQQFEFGKWVVK